MLLSFSVAVELEDPCEAQRPIYQYTIQQHEVKTYVFFQNR